MSDSEAEAAEPAAHEEHGEAHHPPVKRRPPVVTCSLGCMVLMVLGCVGFICSTFFGNTILETATATDVTGVITDKYIKRVGEADVYHVAVTYSDGTTEVFWNQDSLAFSKFDSADVQQALSIGQTYRLTVAGWRIPLFSSFRNIVRFEKILSP